MLVFPFKVNISFLSIKKKRHEKNSFSKLFIWLSFKFLAYNMWVVLIVNIHWILATFQTLCTVLYIHYLS